jgi:hypothetical protein
VNLDDIIRRLRKAEEAAFMRGDGDTYTLLLCAGSKLAEARELADHITDFEDVLDTETGDKATNFLCSGCRSA